MKKFLLAYNPVSGDAMFKKKLDDIINRFQSRDCIVIPYRTKKESYLLPLEETERCIR